MIFQDKKEVFKKLEKKNLTMILHQIFEAKATINSFFLVRMTKKMFMTLQISGQTWKASDH